MSPISRLNTVMTPKWTTSIPRASTVGMRIGTKTSRMGTVSTMLPSRR